VNAVTVAVTGVTLNKATLTLTAGSGTETLMATVAPDNATDKSITWTSSDTAVATVSSSGVVTAVAAGTATITVITTDGNKTATCAVTVNPALTTVTDADGNIYRTKVYNGVEWMIDNSQKTTGVTGCTYAPIDVTTIIKGVDYGYLYSRSCAATACPSGWSLPTEADFIALVTALTDGGASAWADWNSGSSLAGYGLGGSYDGGQGSVGGWWCSSSSNRGWRVSSGLTSGGFYTNYSSYSFSVRCRKSQ
jgi:uncharacterized protein (TIGR02145 family)